MNAAEITDTFEMLYMQTYNYPCGLLSPFDRDGAAVLAQVDGGDVIGVVGNWPAFMHYLTSRAILSWTPPRPSLGLIAAHHGHALAFLRTEGVPIHAPKPGPTIDTSGIVVLSDSAVKVA